MATPDMVRTAAGTMVPAQRSFASKPPVKKFLLVIQYWAGDQEHAEEVAELICDLERVRNRDVDVLIFARHDAPAFSQTARDRLGQKFGKVMFERCRRRDATGYPFGSNSMFYDMVCLFSQYPQWANDYFAFIPLEADCCPMHPGWIGELIRAYQDAEAIGKSCTGFLDPNPVEHINGVAVYAIDIWKRVGTHKLSGGNPRVAYDIHQAKNILPHATTTPFIMFEYRKPTITADELFSPSMPIEPALFHGVKDSSAREAVRARYITMSERRDVSAKTVFTFSNPTPNTNRAEETALLQMWADGWKSRGWNPVVLTRRDAARHSRFAEMIAAFEKLPTIGERDAALNRLIRWLALDLVGGGFMVEKDVVPNLFTPDAIARRDVGLVISQDNDGISGAVFDRQNVQKFIEAIIRYDVKPEDSANGQPNITDMTVWRAHSPEGTMPIIVAFGDPGATDAKLLRFSVDAMSRNAKGEKPVVAMERFLRST